MADGVGKRSLEVQGKELTPESSKAWIDSIRHTYRHNASEELDCIPSADAGSWLTWEMIRGCQHSDAGRPELYMGGYCTIGIDVARSKHLWVASVLEDVAGVQWPREMQTLENKRFSEQRAVVRALVMRYKVVRFAVNQTGMGESFVEDLQDQHGRSHVEGVLMTSNRRLDITTELKWVHEDRLIRIPDDEATELDLHSIKRKAGPTGAPRLVASENDTDDHADRYWSLGLAAAAAGSGVPTTVATGAAADRQGRRRGE